MIYMLIEGFPVDLPETWVQSLGREEPLMKESHSRTLALENPMDRRGWWVIVHGVTK